MKDVTPVVNFDREGLLREVVLVLEDMTGDWDIAYSGGIGPKTCLISDLTAESIDIVQFVVALEERFKRRDLPFENLLMIDGRYVDDFSVEEVVDFLYVHLNNRSSGA
jgi:acyl carrier protein